MCLPVASHRGFLDEDHFHSPLRDKAAWAMSPTRFGPSVVCFRHPPAPLELGGGALTECVHHASKRPSSFSPCGGTGHVPGVHVSVYDLD